MQVFRNEDRIHKVRFKRWIHDVSSFDQFLSFHFIGHATARTLDKTSCKVTQLFSLRLWRVFVVSTTSNHYHSQKIPNRSNDEAILDSRPKGKLNRAFSSQHRCENTKRWDPSIWKTRQDWVHDEAMIPVSDVKKDLNLCNCLFTEILEAVLWSSKDCTYWFGIHYSSSSTKYSNEIMTNGTLE